MSINFKYKPEGQVLKTFMKSNDFFRGIRGPVGSGKSVSCCIEVFRRSLLQKKNKNGRRKNPNYKTCKRQDGRTSTSGRKYISTGKTVVKTHWQAQWLLVKTSY